MMNWLGASLCIILLPIVTSAMDNNPYPGFFFFGGITLAFCVMDFFLLIETKGLTTEQIYLKYAEKTK